MACNLSWNLGILICGVLILYTGEGMAQLHVHFTISPRNILFGGQNPTSGINFTCAPGTDEMKDVLGFEIGKVYPYGIKSKVVGEGVAKPADTVKVVVNGTRQRGDYYFCALGTSGYLKYLLRDLRCSDAGTYYCTSKLMDSDNGAKLTTTIVQTVSVMGDQNFIQMTVRPDKKAYDVNDNVEFTCSGVIGSKFDEDMVKHWVWERMENKNWTKFMESDTRISISGATPANNCTFHSTLKYLFQSTDAGRQFRCSLKDTQHTATATLGDTVGAGNTKEIGITVSVASAFIRKCRCKVSFAVMLAMLFQS